MDIASLAGGSGKELTMSVGENSNFGGSIHVRLNVSGERVMAVDVISTRPTETSRVLLGHAPGQVVTLIGRLYSLCSRAQTIAALKALEHAQQMVLAPQHAVARNLLRLAEMLSQTALRLCMDWPRLLGLPLEPVVVRACLGAEQQLEQAVFAAARWKTPGGISFAPDLDAVRDKIAQLQVLINTTVLHGGLADQLRWAVAELHLEGFGAVADTQKYKDGATHEDGALTRHWDAAQVLSARHAHGLGLLARLEARLADMAFLPQALSEAAAALASGAAAGASSVASGEGQASVETARGKLTHSVTVKDGLITAYAIEAPTDANFAQGGPVAAGLVGADASNVAALCRAAELHVLAIDPCVNCVLEVNHA
jgi:coenzyme F420-reducing hydrogenase alpha subunit